MIVTIGNALHWLALILFLFILDKAKSVLNSEQEKLRSSYMKDSRGQIIGVFAVLILTAHVIEVGILQLQFGGWSLALLFVPFIFLSSKRLQELNLPDQYLRLRIVAYLVLVASELLRGIIRAYSM